VLGVFLGLASVDNGDLDRSSLAACLPRWDWHACTAAGEVPARIRGAEIVIANKIPLDRHALGAAGALRLVAVAATGTNNVVNP
jgi:glycerate dehydrogenase